MSREISRRSFLAAGSAAALAAQTGSKVKLGIIGTGHRAWLFLQVFKAIPDIEVIALADPTPKFLDRAASIAGEGASRYKDYRRMLEEEKALDAVLVATPGSLHADPVVAAFEHGLHVLCEKPMATSVADANRMIEASEKAGKILQIGHQMRHTPIYEKMAQVVLDQGRIGKVQFAAGHLFRGDWNPNSWKAPHPETGEPAMWRLLRSVAGSSLLEDGLHEIDILHWLAGAQVTRVFATGGNNVYKDRETIDHAGLTVDYDNGAKLTFSFCLFAEGRREKMTVIGDQGLIEPVEDGVLVQMRSGGEPAVEEVHAEPPAGLEANIPMVSYNALGTYREVLAFLDHIRTGGKPLSGGKVGKDAIKISLLAQKSIDEGRAMAWDELPA